MYDTYITITRYVCTRDVTNDTQFGCIDILLYYDTTIYCTIQ